MSAASKTAEEIAIGDTILFLGTEHRVVEIESYEGPLSTFGAFGVACGVADWRITLFTGQVLQVAV